LTAPVFKSIALAGLVIGLGAAAASSSPAAPVTYRLALHAADAPDSVYLTVFRHGDIQLQFRGGAIHPITFRTYASVFDGCRWVGVEKLVPRDARSFDYDYREQILSCEPGATPTNKTPRTGIVTIED
jgi:hypothetical protein